MGGKAIYKCRRERMGRLNHRVVEHLFLIILFFIFTLVDVVILKQVSLLISGDDTEPVTKLMLLEEALGKVLEVSLGEMNGSVDGDLVVGTDNLDLVFKVVGTAVDLDVVMEVLLIGGNIKDLVRGRTRAVDDKLAAFRLLGSGSRLSNGHVRCS